MEEWSPYLPSYVDPDLSLLAEQQQQQQQGLGQAGGAQAGGAASGVGPNQTTGIAGSEEEEEDEDGILGEGEFHDSKLSTFIYILNYSSSTI